MSVFETATRVPLVVRTPWRSGSAGRVVASPVELVSLYRSLAELAGIPTTAIESTVQGTSFAPLMVGAEIDIIRGGEVALSQMTRCKKGTENGTQTRGYDPCAKTVGEAMGYTYMGYSVRSAEWRFTLWAEWNGTSLCPEWNNAANKIELYDHRRDMEAANFDDFENINVAADNAGVVTQMTALVHSSFGSSNC